MYRNRPSKRPHVSSIGRDSSFASARVSVRAESTSWRVARASSAASLLLRISRVISTLSPTISKPKRVAVVGVYGGRFGRDLAKVVLSK